MGVGTTIWTTGRPCRCVQPFAGIITDGEKEWCSCGCGYYADYDGDKFDPFAGMPDELLEEDPIEFDELVANRR